MDDADQSLDDDSSSLAMPTISDEIDITTIETPKEDTANTTNDNVVDITDESAVTLIPDNTTEGLESVATPVQQAILRTFQASRTVNVNSGAKQVAIAPKPFSFIKKITVSNIRPKPAPLVDSSGRQVVVIPNSSNQIKLVKSGSTIQTGGFSGQVLQIRQASNVPPLTKLAVVQEGETSPSTTAKAPRYISLQQAQQMGLVPPGKINQVVTVSPIKQSSSNTTPTMSPTTIRQVIPTIKSPAKILPAPPKGTAPPGKVIIAPMRQNYVIQPTSKSGQIIRMEGGSSTSGTILTTLPAGQKFNSQQLHQINVPGKGLQFVRLVTPIQSSQQQKLGHTSPVRIAPIPSTTSRVLQTSAKLVQAKSSHVLPKSFMIDIHGNIVEVAQSNSQVLTTITTSTGASSTTGSATSTSNAINRVISKPVTTKLIPITISMTSSIQKFTQSSTPTNFTITSIPATKTILKEEVTDFVKTNMLKRVEKIEIVDDENNESGDGTEEQLMEMSRQLMKASTSGATSSDTKHIVMLPNYMQMQIKNQSSNAHSKALNVSSNIDLRQEPDSRNIDCSLEFGMRPRKPCNCTKSQCLKLYCDCFANGEFCNNCNCNNCFNNLENEEYRQKAIRTCLDRNPNAFRPKIGKAKNYGLEVIRRHNKGCHCKRSGCLKNYCECYEGKIACSANCKCIGCRNIEDSYDKKSFRKVRSEIVLKRYGDNEDMDDYRDTSDAERSNYFSTTASSMNQNIKRPSTYMTNDLIDAICACLLAQAADAEAIEGPNSPTAVQHVLEEFSRCLQDLVSTTQTLPMSAIPDDARGTSS